VIDLTADQRTAVRFALALCREETFSTLDVDNRVTAKRLTAHQAVASGDAFFGSCRPEVWGIDIDGPSHPAVQYLRYVIAWTGVESLECLSGRDDHRHLFVAVRDEADRDCIQEQIRIAYPNLPPGVIDWRRQRTGSPLRPPGAPHRSGGRSEPMIDADEALEIVESWCEPQTPAPVERRRRALSEWCEAALQGELDRCDRLKARPLGRKANGERDRSALDVSIALEYRNKGRSKSEFVSDRRPGGPFPSPKAVEVPDPDRYLDRQWESALSRPDPIASHRDGLDRLDEYVVAFEADPDLSSVERQVLHGFVRLAERYEKTVPAVAYRQLVEESLTSLDTVSASITSRRLSRYLSAPIEPSADDWNESPEYRLRVLETVRSPFHEQSSLPPPVRTDCSSAELLRLRVHPVFCHHKRGGRGQACFETLTSFSDVEGRSVAEALRAATNVGRSAHREHTTWLTEIGALGPDPENPKLKRRVPGFDWDAIAVQRCVHDIRERLAKRHRDDRREMLRWKQQNGMSATDAVNEFAALARRRTLPDEADNAGVRTVVRFDTGEIIGTDPVMVGRGSTATGLFRACGCNGATMDPHIGLRRHHGCLFAPWMAEIERRHGASIPDELIKHPLPVPDWGNFRPEPNSLPGDVLELPNIPTHTVVD